MSLAGLGSHEKREGGPCEAALRVFVRRRAACRCRAAVSSRRCWRRTRCSPRAPGSRSAPRTATSCGRCPRWAGRGDGSPLAMALLRMCHKAGAREQSLRAAKLLVVCRAPRLPDRRLAAPSAHTLSMCLSLACARVQALSKALEVVAGRTAAALAESSASAALEALQAQLAELRGKATEAAAAAGESESCTDTNTRTRIHPHPQDQDFTTCARGYALESVGRRAPAALRDRVPVRVDGDCVR